MRRNSLAALALAALIAGPAAAEGLHGRLSFTGVAATTPESGLDAALGYRHSSNLIGNGRLEWAKSFGRWDVNVQYELSFILGSGTRLARARAAALPYQPPPATLFDLTNTLRDKGDVTAIQMIDRLSLGYSAPHFVFRIGRQALTWGAGQVFHPLDLIDPFPPGTFDTEFKPGVDMIYAQYLFDSGADLQAIAVPRARRQGGRVSAMASTFALKYHRSLGSVGTTWLLARDHGETTAGIGLSGPLGGASWNAELVPTFTGGHSYTSELVNISAAATLAGHSATLYAEYFRNGFGTSSRGAALDTLPPVLVDRLLRGEIFTTSRNYIAGGLSIEATPLLTLSPNLIVNLDDRSAYLTAEANWSLSDNTNLIFGTALPVGPRGTEYGGLPVTAGSAIYDTPQRMVYAELRRHF